MPGCLCCEGGGKHSARVFVNRFGESEFHQPAERRIQTGPLLDCSSASHGHSTGTPEQFRVDLRRKLNLDDLERLIVPSIPRAAGGALALSACQTAVGDERAARLREWPSNPAPGVLATLWSVNDEISSRLVSSFTINCGRTARCQGEGPSSGAASSSA